MNIFVVHSLEYRIKKEQKHPGKTFFKNYITGLKESKKKKKTKKRRSVRTKPTTETDEYFCHFLFVVVVAPSLLCNNLMYN